MASLVWQGLTNKDIAAVLGTSEQVVKNYLRTTFDKLGVWTRLELALYVAGHGGASWRLAQGRSAAAPPSAWNAGVGGDVAPFAAGTKAAAASPGGTL
ncbi:MAG: helix-turn-helix transcriptional regulator [Terriglobales bacterium]